MRLDQGSITICVLGAGSVRCTPAVIGSFATYFGERPLEIRLWDADEERLDLFDRFARVCFACNKCKHRLIATTDAADALDDCDRIIVTVGENCARKAFGGPALTEAVGRLTEHFEAGVRVLSLVDTEVQPDWQHLAWPEEPSEIERRAIPHQVLRFIYGDEFVHDFLRTFRASPIKRWLDDPDQEF